MNLQRIKILADEKRINFKNIACEIGMSEGNLHRCVRENKIQANVLEKIAQILGVSIIEFFEENVSNIHTEGDYSPATLHGNASVSIGNAISAERIKAMEMIIQEKDERIKELKERIDDLKSLR